MLNKVMLLGNLGRDPEYGQTQGGVHWCTFSIATSFHYKDKQGEKIEKTEWHRIRTYGGTADSCGKYLKKGAKVFVEGRIETRKWKDDDGKEKYSTEIVATDVRFLSEKKSGDGGGSDGGSRRRRRRDEDEDTKGLDFKDTESDDEGGESLDIADDDIPF